MSVSFASEALSPCQERVIVDPAYKAAKPNRATGVPECTSAHGIDSSQQNAMGHGRVKYWSARCKTPFFEPETQHSFLSHHLENLLTGTSPVGLHKSGHSTPETPRFWPM